MDNNRNCIKIDGVEYRRIEVSVYDRVGHRVTKRYDSDVSGLTSTWMMWTGLNAWGRYAKTLYGTSPDGRRRAIARF